MSSRANLIIYEEDFRRINACLTALHDNARSKAALLIEKSGQLIASAGKTDGLDTTSLASLAAGNIAAAGGLAQVLGEREFFAVFHEGEREHLYLSLIGGRLIILVLFDHRSPVGLVRLLVKTFSREIEQIIADTLERPRGPGESRLLSESVFADVTDEDVDNLFGRE